MSWMSGSKCVEKYTYNVCYDFIWDIQPSKEACAKRCYENLEHCESWSYRAMRGPAAQYGGRCNLSASRCKETKPWYQSGPPYVWGTRECGNVDDHNNGKGVFKSMKYLSINIWAKCCMLANQPDQVSFFLVTSCSCTGQSSCASAVKF